MYEACQQINAALQQVPFLARIANDAEHRQALALLETLLKDYDGNARLIEILSMTIERWESEDPAFREFNQQLAALDTGMALIRTLMGQHRLSEQDQPSFVCEQPSGFTHSGVYRHVARHKVACHSPLLHSTLSCFFDCNLSVNIDSVAFCRRPSFLINISFKYKWIGRSTWLQKQALNSHCNL